MFGLEYFLNFNVGGVKKKLPYKEQYVDPF